MNKEIPETVIVKNSKHGKGIFTTVDLPKNSLLFNIKGKQITFEETLKLDDDQCYCLQISLDKYIIAESPFLFSNHSCDPNCGINKKMDFITLKNIKAGEELQWDYSTSMMERHWTLKCQCEQFGCRGIIRDFDLLPSSKQKQYLQMQIVLPFIVENIYGLTSINKIISPSQLAVSK